MKERQKVMVERLFTHVKEVRKQQPVCLKPNQIRCASDEMRRVISGKRLRTIEPARAKRERTKQILPQVCSLLEKLCLLLTETQFSRCLMHVYMLLIFFLAQILRALLVLNLRQCSSVGQSMPFRPPRGWWHRLLYLMTL